MIQARARDMSNVNGLTTLAAVNPPKGAPKDLDAPIIITLHLLFAS